MAVLKAKLRPATPHALSRARLDDVLQRAWDHRLTLICGPPGSGKTTLLSQFVTSTDGPVAWYRPESSDTSVELLLAHLAAAFQLVLPGTPDEWASVDDAVIDLESRVQGPLALAVDDLHVLADSPAGQALERLVDFGPAPLHVVATSRRPPEWNLSRLRVSGKLLEVSSDDLRFRSWEVERLFTDLYREPLPPADLARLTRDVEGWAAGLQLFHLATRGKPAHQRRQAIAVLPLRSRLVRDYLARNVIDELPVELRDFLFDTCVLGQLSGPLCDRLLGRTGSGLLLEELEERQLFVLRMGDGGCFRYHEVFRRHLETGLVERVGETDARHRFQGAAELLEMEGMAVDALRAFCRAEDWEGVGRILKTEGAELADGPGSWLDALPPSLLDGDPWVTLATARRLLSSGQLARAEEIYQRADPSFGTGATSGVFLRELTTLRSWLHPGAAPPLDWTGQLRSALAANPADAAVADRGTPTAVLVAGLGTLLAGECRRASTALAAVADDPFTSPVIRAIAVVGRSVADAMATSPPPTALRPEALRELVDLADNPWLSRAARAAAALAGDPASVVGARSLADEADRLADLWGAVFARLCCVIGSANAGREALGDAERLLEQIATARAGTLETWTMALRAYALHLQGRPDAAAAAVEARRRAIALGVPGAEAIARSVEGWVEGPAGHDAVLAAADLADALGMRLPPARAAARPSPSARSCASVTICCLGGFEMHLAGQAVPLATVKPRARSALRLLALDAGSPVHAETIIAALWPDVDMPTGKRNLQVAVSSLRRALSDCNVEVGGNLLRREGSAYTLAVPVDAAVDVLMFHDAVRRARSAARRDDRDPWVEALEDAVSMYGGELLPEEGPAEWLSDRRQQMRAEAADAACTLAELLLAGGDFGGSTAACERGLAIDRYHDGAWRTLIAAHDAAGDAAAVGRARTSYRAVLDELGIAPDGVVDERSLS